MTNNKGFSLLELSIVLVVLGFITTSSLTITRGILNHQKQKITKERMYKIEEAIKAFVDKNGRLPCPAGIKTKYSLDSNISEGTTIGIICITDENGEFCLPEESPSSINTTCHINSSAGIKKQNNLVIGTIPATALDLQNNEAMDGWSNKFVYVVAEGYTIKDLYYDYDGIFTNVSSGKLINGKYAYAIISNGRNQYYSYSFAGDTEKNNSSNSLKDKSNSYNNISGTTVNNGWGDVDFDDFVIMKTSDAIIRDLDLYDRDCKITVDVINDARNVCGTDFFTSVAIVPGGYERVKYGSKKYANEEVYETKTIMQDDGSSKEVKIKLKMCVLECMRWGKMRSYLSSVEL